MTDRPRKPQQTKLKRASLILMTCALLPGCAFAPHPAGTTPRPVQQLKIVADTLCDAPKMKWGFDSTKEDRRQARIFNARWDAACLKKPRPTERSA